MAQSAQCSAVSGAMQRQGTTDSIEHPWCDLTRVLIHTGLSYAQLASKVGTSEARIQQICSGQVHPTTAEFNSLAQALGISNAPHDAAHATK
ncbi:hypothetical protein F5I97DRAFT_1922801 [Phlebopus sp. FC_14]|nr:hypothetical protein F5I97DRAFT_1922801 [Phlebopus sp. FC_14]